MPTENRPGTVASFIADHGISALAEETDCNPNMDPDDPWSRRATHWRVLLRRRGQVRKHVVYFSMGSAHQSAPTAYDVLSCIRLDSASVDGARSFEEWARDMGYDADSRRAERIYKSCVAAGARLRRFLGEELYRSLLNATDDEEESE